VVLASDRDSATISLAAVAEYRRFSRGVCGFVAAVLASISDIWGLLCAGIDSSRSVSLCLAPRGGGVDWWLLFSSWYFVRWATHCVELVV
jgi:hypothetical protein